MRVLVVGKRGGILHWLENVMDAFSTLQEVEARAFCVNHIGYFDKFWKNIVKKCSRTLLDQIISDQFVRQVELFKPNLILLVDYFYIPEQLFQVLSLRNHRATVAWWIGDLFDRELVSRHACIDKYYFTDSYFIDYAADAGIHNTGYLPLAYNPEIFRRENEGFRKSTMAFVGAYAENRAAILRQIAQPVLVVGKKWDRLGATHHEIRARRVAIKDVAVIYNQHMGVLNIKNSGNVVNGLNMRTFDAPACGCVVINDALGDLDRCFEIGKELLVYHCPEELNEHYRRLLADDRERIRIAEAGRRRVLAEHQYRHRILSVLQELF